jgi:hypothetical protein
MAKRNITKQAPTTVTADNFDATLENIVKGEKDAAAGKLLILDFLAGLVGYKALNAFDMRRHNKDAKGYAKALGITQDAGLALAGFVELINKATGNAWQGWKRLLERNLKGATERKGATAQQKATAKKRLVEFQAGANKQKVGNKTGKKKGATTSKDKAPAKPEDAISIADAVGTGPEMALNILAQVVAGLLQLAGKEGMKNKATAANVSVAAAMETLRGK